MRVAPIALFARDDPAANASYSADSSRITHANPLCVAGCVALNAAVAALLTDPGANAVTVAAAASDDETVHAAIARAPSLNAGDLDAGGYVLATLQAAFWALTAHDSVEDAVVAAVNLGADADTTGAVVGALAGARWGMAAIPERWLQALRPRDELIELADNLFELSRRGAGP
jgi:ADP-ribosyl-[dinitrogen reductase] hydrolase